MKRYFVGIIGLCILFGHASQATALPSAYLIIDKTSMHPGDTFRIDVWLDSDGVAEDFLGFGVSLPASWTSDPTVNPSAAGFTRTAVTFGDYFDNTGTPGSTYNISGSTKIGLSVPSDTDVLLFSISAIADGIVSGSQSIYGNPNYPDYYRTVNGLVYTNSSYIASDSVRFEITEPVPEPATMLLFGTGVAGLAGSRIRRKKAVDFSE